MAADRFSAGKAGDRLVDDSLENGCCKVFPCCALVDQRLNIGLCKHTASGSDRIDRMMAPRINIEAGGIRTEKVCHLVDKGPGSACADTVHTLFYISLLEINDLGILTAELDRDVSCGTSFLKACGDRDDLLYERYTQMLCERQSAGPGDRGGYFEIAQRIVGFTDKTGAGLLDLGIVSLIIREEKIALVIQQSDLYGR